MGDGPPVTHAAVCSNPACDFTPETITPRPRVNLPRGSSVFICPSCHGTVGAVHLHPDGEQDATLFQCEACGWRAMAER
jgi:predicted RNA-binding Zn-ribbon protein involved in translation (DUF1610 family)